MNSNDKLAEVIARHVGKTSGIYRYIMADIQALTSKPAGVGDWVLVPERMQLTPENMELLATSLGGIDPESEDIDDRWCGGVLWVGETIGDDGEKFYGLNVANAECLEEGSIPIIEFAAPTKPDSEAVRLRVGDSNFESWFAGQYAVLQSSPAVITPKQGFRIAYEAGMNDAASQPVGNAGEVRSPDGLAYRYPDGYIRHNNGGEINGSRPIEAIPYFYRNQPAPADEVGGKIGEVCMVPVSHDYCGKRVKLVEVADGSG